MAEIKFNEKYSEIFKLHNMLTDAKIEHDFIERTVANKSYVYQIFYPNNESWENYLDGETVRSLSCSVIEGWYSIGGDKNLLEIFGLAPETEGLYDSVVGYLTAENVFERIKEAEEQRKLLSKHVGRDCSPEEN